jgi:hypothetical protein
MYRANLASSTPKYLYRSSKLLNSRSHPSHSVFHDWLHVEYPIDMERLLKAVKMGWNQYAVNMERNEEPGAMHAALISYLIYVEYSLMFNAFFGFHILHQWSAWLCILAVYLPISPPNKRSSGRENENFPAYFDSIYTSTGHKSRVRLRVTCDFGLWRRRGEARGEERTRKAAIQLRWGRGGAMSGRGGVVVADSVVSPFNLTASPAALYLTRSRRAVWQQKSWTAWLSVDAELLGQHLHGTGQGIGDAAPERKRRKRDWAGLRWCTRTKRDQVRTDPSILQFFCFW